MRSTITSINSRLLFTINLKLGHNMQGLLGHE